MLEIKPVLPMEPIKPIRAIKKDEARSPRRQTDENKTELKENEPVHPRTYIDELA
jgi:hypothetical protein